MVKYYDNNKLYLLRTTHIYPLRGASKYKYQLIVELADYTFNIVRLMDPSNIGLPYDVIILAE